jgi:hypothetical protein
MRLNINADENLRNEATRGRNGTANALLKLRSVERKKPGFRRFTERDSPALKKAD